MTGLWINRFFLARLSEESYVVQKKAFIFAWISVIVIPLLVIPTVFNITTAVSTHPAVISIANVLMVFGFIAALVFLRKGMFDLAVTIGILFVSVRVIVGALTKLGTWIATGNNNNVYFMFGALAFTATILRVIWIPQGKIALHKRRRNDALLCQTAMHHARHPQVGYP